MWEHIDNDASLLIRLTNGTIPTGLHDIDLIFDIRVAISLPILVGACFSSPLPLSRRHNFMNLRGPGIGVPN